ncbi:ribosome maturation factor RimM [Catellatospora sp. TT07R-123]|uniref:ribosome maturation factor RimM n=1 Tax=Catellatospora sp. TT07R-123 TaxID=2733863 RepID=UPI001AFD2048|nr:ribosome maturation factor RimM [Catellatospora sp. TT07R-123]GHJ49809.1 ribosome maturation factor RimM [Catellatospora sp. TT07R-123]
MLLIVGHVVRAHGIRGEILVQPRTDEPEQRFAVGSTLIVEPAVAGLPGTLTVESVRAHLGRYIIVCPEIPDRNTAELAKSALLNVDSADVPAPEDPDEFLDHHLVGLSVVTVGGEPLGKVTRIDHAPSSDLLVVRMPDGRTGLIPFVSAIVPEVDVAGGRIVVDPPGGLFDL